MSDVQSLYSQARKLTLSVANGIARLEGSTSQQVGGLFLCISNSLIDLVYDTWCL
jgi:hypothetical protein